MYKVTDDNYNHYFNLFVKLANLKNKTKFHIWWSYHGIQTYNGIHYKCLICNNIFQIKEDKQESYDHLSDHLNEYKHLIPFM